MNRDEYGRNTDKRKEHIPLEIRKAQPSGRAVIAAIPIRRYPQVRPQIPIDNN